MLAFARYSGAEAPTASLKGLLVYLAKGDAPPAEVLPTPSPRKYWNRRGVAEWLVELLSGDVPTLVGIDHGFSPPGFPGYGSSARTLGIRLHFWRFDGWEILTGRLRPTIPSVSKTASESMPRFAPRISR